MSSRSSPFCRIAQLLAGIFRLQNTRERIRSFQIAPAESELQKCHDVVFFLTLPSATPHCDLVSGAQSDTGDAVLDYRWQMGLVDDSKDLVGAFNSIGDKSGIDTDKYVVLRVRNNSSLKK